MLLQACPIHGCELADRCNCGELFAGDQVVLHHMNAGYCRCGRMAFFTSQTCRRPTMRHDETAPMSMVAAWLERLAGVTRPSPSDRLAQRAHDRILLDSAGAWCDELNLGNPGSAIAPDLQPLRASISVARLSTVERTNAVRPATHSRDRVASTRGKRSLYWSADDATTIYRSLARHIRQHVARGAEGHAIDFMLNPDPLQMGAVIRTRRQVMLAFADLLFTECMETYAGLRRWPYRDPQAGATSRVRNGLAHVSVDGGHDWPPTLREARLAWVRRQAARSCDHARLATGADARRSRSRHRIRQLGCSHREVHAGWGLLLDAHRSAQAERDGVLVRRPTAVPSDLGGGGQRRAPALCQRTGDAQVRLDAAAFEQGPAAGNLVRG